MREVKKIILMLWDIVLVQAAFYCALILRFDGALPGYYRKLYIEKVLEISIIMIISFWICKLYNELWRYASFNEAFKIIDACYLGTSILYIIDHILCKAFPTSIYLMFTCVIILLMGAFRYSNKINIKMVMAFARKKQEEQKKSKSVYPTRVLLVGAGSAASLMIKEGMDSELDNRKIILAVDDDKRKMNSTINGIKIRGQINHIVELALEHKIDEIIIAIPSASKKRISEIIEICNQTSCKIKIFTGVHNAINTAKEDLNYHIREVNIEDLLGREEIILDDEGISEQIKEKVVMVTGGGGSIGSELCRQVIRLEPKKLVIFEIYENNAYELQMELLQQGIEAEKIDIVIGSVRDYERLQKVFERYKPQVVFHAAAHKHVPLMEKNSSEAIKNNVFGTLNSARCALNYGAEKFVLISTDKAVNPTNIMGASKRICEMIIQSINQIAEHTDFVAVRFGNVLGSNGSVLPLFKKQLAAGGPLTVTHPQIIRYFMTIPEAVRLILEATTFAKGGEIFVLDMGKPVKILDLAKNFIKLSGLELGKDIQIEFTGLRPGEKLYEELLMEEEGLAQTPHEKIFIGKPIDIKYEVLMNQLERLKDVLEDETELRRILMEIVPTYSPRQEEKIAI